MKNEIVYLMHPFNLFCSYYLFDYALFNLTIGFRFIEFLRSNCYQVQQYNIFHWMF